MYMAKAVAAFISLVVTALVSAPDIIPVSGTVHLVISIVAILAGSVTTYAVPNRSSNLVERVVD